MSVSAGIPSRRTPVRSLALQMPVSTLMGCQPDAHLNGLFALENSRTPYGLGRLDRKQQILFARRDSCEGRLANQVYGCFLHFDLEWPDRLQGLEQAGIELPGFRARKRESVS